MVHGGQKYAQPIRMDPGLLQDLEEFIPLAPLHQPHNLTPIRLMLERRPDLPQVACFDTAFHRAQPELAQMFALPMELHEEGVRRYGFHGLSYEYIASTLPQVDLVAAKGRTVVCHLGNGASMCALSAGRSVASTMGFTAVDGLPMGTRCGTLDPGVIVYLMDQRGMDARAMEARSRQQSGLLGVSGVSSDMRTLLASAEPRRSSLSISTSTASGASWVRWRLRWAAWTPSSSPVALARTAPRSASACAATRRSLAATMRSSRGQAPAVRRRKQERRVGGSHQRGTDDCPAHPPDSHAFMTTIAAIPQGVTPWKWIHGAPCLKARRH